jgi:hypothetical protein
MAGTCTYVRNGSVWELEIPCPTGKPICPSIAEAVPSDDLFQSALALTPAPADRLVIDCELVGPAEGGRQLTYRRSGMTDQKLTYQSTEPKSLTLVAAGA